MLVSQLAVRGGRVRPGRASTPLGPHLSLDAVNLPFLTKGKGLSTFATPLIARLEPSQRCKVWVRCWLLTAVNPIVYGWRCIPGTIDLNVRSSKIVSSAFS